MNDWKEREHWDEYTDAYEAVIEKCSAPHAPWYVVPADSKWYRNLVIAEAVAAAMRPYKQAWLDKLDEDGAEGRRGLAEYRRTQGSR